MTGLYILVDEKNGDIFTESYDTEKEAVEAGAHEWDRLTEHDKKERKAFYVLRSVADDVDAENALDGDVVKSWV